MQTKPHAHLALLSLGEDSVVRLERVLFEQLGLVDDLHVEERVAHGEECERRRHLLAVYWTGQRWQGQWPAFELPFASYTRLTYKLRV